MQKAERVNLVLLFVFGGFGYFWITAHLIYLGLLENILNYEVLEKKRSFLIDEVVLRYRWW